MNLLIPDIFGHYKKERILTNSMYPKNTDYRRNTIHTYIHELYTQGRGGGGLKKKKNQEQDKKEKRGKQISEG